jgi:hypothetical protein
MALKITPGSTADSTVLDELTRHLTGQLYADKGYISRQVFSKLWQRGLHLITGIHILSCLVAYAYGPGKPSISLRGQKIEAYP